jgi:protocatechuate 3,4-dioxygenase beta subunit
VRLSLLIALLAVVGVLVGAWCGASSAALLPEPRGDGDASAQSAAADAFSTGVERRDASAPARSVLRSTDEVPEAPDAVGEEPRAALRVRVVDALDGAPVSALRVGVWGEPDLLRCRTDGPIVTDEHGMATVWHDGPFRVKAINIASSTGYPPHVEQVELNVGVTESAGSRNSASAGAVPNVAVEHEIRLPRGGRVAGTVVDEVGRTVAHASVRCWFRSDPGRIAVGPRPVADREVSADENGRFVIDRVGGRFRLEASAGQRWGVETLDVTMRGRPAVDGLVARIGPTVLLEGRVLGPERRPVAGADVRALPLPGVGDEVVPGVRVGRPLQLGGIESGPDGRFTVRAVRDRVQRWFVRAQGYRLAEVDHRPGDGPLEIVLERGSQRRGIVFLPTGEPAVGATVRGGPDGRTLTDVDGEWTLRDGRDRWLTVFHPEAALHVAIPAPRPGEFHVTRLEPAMRLAGRVVDVGGEPVAGVVVELRGGRLIDSPAFSELTWQRACDEVPDRARTDADGRFEFGNLYSSDFELWVQHPDDERLVRRVRAKSGDENVEVVLDPARMRGVAISGRVLDAVTGEPIPWFDLRVLRRDRRGKFLRATQQFGVRDDGGFAIVGLDDGVYRFWVQAPGYVSWQSKERELVPGEHALDVRLAREVDLFVRFVENGDPVQAWLAALDAAGETVMIGVEGGSSLSKVLVPEEGQQFFGLPAGPLTMVVEAPPGRPAVEHSVVLAPGMPAQLVVEVRAGR